jgi:hypothetical protein
MYGSRELPNQVKLSCKHASHAIQFVLRHVEVAILPERIPGALNGRYARNRDLFQSETLTQRNNLFAIHRDFVLAMLL